MPHPRAYGLCTDAVKIIGWGEATEQEGGAPYWLIQNSWGPKWGEAGFFRMLRGKDECGIESNVAAGTPKPPA